MRYEYSVVPAPTRGEKVKGAKTPADRYALAMAGELNRLAAEGWEYVRAETLPSEERVGLTGRNTIYHNVLVFRRALAALDSVADPAPATKPQPEYPVEASPPEKPVPTPELPQAAAPQPSERDGKKLDDPGRAKPPAPRVSPSDAAN